MQCRAGGRHRHRAGRARQGGQPTLCSLEIGTPDVASVDDSGHQGLVGQLRHRRDGRISAGDQVDADGLDRCARQGGQCGVEPTEVGRDEDRRALGVRSQRGVGALGQLGTVVQDVGHQYRLIELNPRHPGPGEQTQQLGVERNQLAEPRNRRGRAPERPCSVPET